MRHKHADLIHAWAEGAEVEYLSPFGKWLGCVDHPYWDESCEYRIKPQKKPDVVRFAKIERENGPLDLSLEITFPRDANVQFTFDGETDKLIKAEVL